MAELALISPERLAPLVHPATSSRTLGTGSAVRVPSMVVNTSCVCRGKIQVLLMALMVLRKVSLLPIHCRNSIFFEPAEIKRQKWGLQLMCGIEDHAGCKAQLVTGNGNEENFGDLEGERREQIKFGEYRLFLGLGKQSTLLKSVFFFKVFWVAFRFF